MTTTNRQMHLVRRPQGAPVEADFAVVDGTVGEPAEGQMLIHNLYLSLDPAFRPALGAGQPLNAPMSGLGMGRVAKSRHPSFAEGEVVTGPVGLQEWCLSDGARLSKLAPDPTLPLTAYLGVLGGTGFTAYLGMESLGKVAAGETVFVSTAAGAVGSVAAQIAKLRGTVVIGSTGSDEKARWLKDDLKLDAVINYRKTSLAEALAAAAPDGLDLYFDNVGGDQLDAALACMKLRGRILVCGAIAAYNQPGYRIPVENTAQIIFRRLTITGFSMGDWAHLRPQFDTEMSAWVRDGAIQWRETILDGIASTPAAFAGVMRGDNTGKMLVKLV